jgi:glycosyltransferase involved in cell wall biosynthesis
MWCDNLPRISCVTVTRGRYEQLIYAIRCFAAQTYPHRELVILSQGDRETNQRIKELVDASGVSSDVQFVEAPESLTLGQMRNTSVEIATGKIICQWDDDDLYHPERLTTQYNALKRGGNVVASLYTVFLKYFADDGTLYLIDHADGSEDYRQVLQEQPFKRFLCGSVMFYKSCFHRAFNRLYPEFGPQSASQEDLNVLQRLMQMGEVIGIDKGHYIYVWHGSNVCDKRHHKFLFHKKRIAGRVELLQQRAVIESTLRAAKIPSSIQVCTTQPVDFDDPQSVISKECVFTYTP